MSGMYRHQVVWLLAGCLLAATAVTAAERKTRLVLQITVDQLRGDALMRFGDRFEKGGFNYLLGNGVYYLNAHYAHANTETAPGHATLATGAHPSRHGIVANDWIDQRTGAFVYNTEDDRHHILGSKPKPHQGVSPRNLLSTTTGDELVVHSGGRSRVFSISAKDRGAILPGGHAGKAFWYSKSSGKFVTSTYYYKEYPEWVAKWNGTNPTRRFSGRAWELLGEREEYIAGSMDDRPYEVDFAGFRRTFPHPFGADEGRFFNVLVGLSPMVDELATEFAMELIDDEDLGQGEVTDYFAISYSSTDYAGHMFGASSLEYEDAVLRLDAQLEKLLQHVDRRVGLDKTLIALSADHGGVEAPEYMQSLGMEAGRHPLDWFRKQNPLGPALKKRFGRDDLIAGHSHPYLYLNLNAIGQAGLDQAEVERFVAEEATRLPGVMYALTRSDLVAGKLANAPVQQMIRRSFHPERSGHVHLVQDQYWFLHSTEEAEKMGLLQSLAAIHGSPWRYDTYVPIVFAGPGIVRRTVSRRVGPHDIAPTIAAYLGVKPPSGSIGDVLPEVMAE